MTTTAAMGDHLGLLDKERIIAPADYNRWLVPPAALAIHLCIGMATASACSGSRCKARS